MDASGFFGAQGTGYTVGQVINQSAPGSVRGAADGTYIGIGAGAHRTSGYMDLGAVPIASTKYNTTALCSANGGGNTSPCMNVGQSGGLPLVVDTTTNSNDFVPAFMGGTGQQDHGMGGNPMLAGPFTNYNANFDITSLPVYPTPLPSAVWLFGPSVLGLLGIARRRKTSPQ